MSNMIKFKAKVVRTLFSSDSFSLYGAEVSKEDEKLVTLNQYDNVTLVGYPIDLTSGVEYEISASSKNDPKYGVQYIVGSAKRNKPRNIDESRTFLREVISETQANELLKHYPDIVDKIINNDLDDIDLNKTHGIKEKTFSNIKNKVISNFGLMDILEKYGGYGISLNVLKKLFDEYHSIGRVETVLRSNPYKALCGISGIGFKTADEMILRLPSTLLGVKGSLRESKQRMLACMLYVLDKNENKGHTKMDANEFRDECLALTPECIRYFVDVVKEDDNLVYFDKKELMMSKTNSYDTEIYIAQKLKQILESNIDIGLPYENYLIDESTGLELTEMQLKALENVSKFNISMLSGSAGSGKSFTISTIIKMLEDNNMSYQLMAPTGKSADIINLYAKRDASTIHRALGYTIDKTTNEPLFMFNEDNNLPHDFIIIDEFSMVDIRLFESLLKAINPKKTRLLFIQDPAQIPSVSSGNCCADMLDSKKIATTTLDRIFRYDEGGLHSVATKVRGGIHYLPKNTGVGVVNFGEKKDYSFIDTGSNSVIDVVRLYMNLIDSGCGVEDIIVMSHHNKGEYGTRILNKALQSKVNPLSKGKKYVTRGDMKYIINDRVMQLSNNYDAKVYYDGSDEKGISIEEMLIKGENSFDTSSNEEDDEDGVPVYNGNTGTIVKVTDNNEIVVDFGKNILILYEREDLEQLDLAYSINIFKMQGSASKITILLTPTAHTYFMNRNLLYTAITRTEDKCYHFATSKLINIALRKSANKDRRTFLKGFLLNKDIEALPDVIKKEDNKEYVDNNGLRESDIPF